MPYAPRLFRCNINASTPGEVVVNTVWIQADEVVNSFVTPQRIADQVRNKWAEMVLTGIGPGLSSPLASYFANGTKFTSVDVYAVNALGKATDQAQAIFAANVKGTGSQAMPPQCAIVTTLLTGAPGRSARGRLFLGGLSTFLDAEGRILPAAQQVLVNNMGGFYKALRDEPENVDDFRPVVASPTTGTARKITRVQVGNVVDTMRSRRGKLVEARLAVSVDE